MQVGRDLGNSGTLWALSAPVVGGGSVSGFTGRWARGLGVLLVAAVTCFWACLLVTMPHDNFQHLYTHNTNNTQVFLVLPM